MSSNARKPPLILPLRHYLQQKKKEYWTLYDVWLNGTDAYRDAPATWPADRCLLTTLPAELLLLVCEGLYQADLFHLALTCRALASVALDLLYKRDIADFDCLGLRWACTLGIVPTLERCLSYGASPNHVFDPHSHAKCTWVLGSVSHFAGFCRGPLQTAIVASEPEIVRLLLAHGADVHAPDPATLGLGQDRSYEVLYPINFAMGTPDMAIFPTFQPGHPAIVRHLLNAGADPNQYTKRQRIFYSTPGGRTLTPLVMAMQAAVPVEAIKLLLEHGADPTRLSSFEGTYIRVSGAFPCHFLDLSPLGVALRYSAASKVSVLDWEKIHLLLIHGGMHELVCFKLGSSPGYPMPLLYRHWDHPQIVDVLKLFIAKGADVANWATTVIPATFSVIWWAEEFVSRLQTYHVQKAMAVISRASTVITLIAEATLVDDSIRAVRRSSIIDAMISADLEERRDRSKGQTALRYLCSPRCFKGATCLIRVLLHYGADMNSTDPQGRTALHHASMFGHGWRVSELVKFLGGPGASGLVVDALDARGWTPLHYACLFGFWSEPGGQVARALLLLSNGADVRARTNNGWTPLSLAVFCANHALVSLLLDHGADARDLFLRRGYDTEPTLAPIGRIVFLAGEPRGQLGPLEPGLASELATSKKAVAGILEDRLGIPVSLPPPLDASLVSPWYALLNEQSAVEGCLAHCRVDAVRYPFAMPREPFSDISAQDIEQDIEGILAVLDYRGLEAWIAPLTDQRGRSMFWPGYPAHSPDDL